MQPQSRFKEFWPHNRFGSNFMELKRKSMNLWLPLLFFFESHLSLVHTSPALISGLHGDASKTVNSPYPPPQYFYSDPSPSLFPTPVPPAPPWTLSPPASALHALNTHHTWVKQTWTTASRAFCLVTQELAIPEPVCYRGGKHNSTKAIQDKLHTLTVL